MVDAVYWVTRDKRRLLITEMETDHLQKALHMIQRSARMKIWTDALGAWQYASSPFSGDMASLAAEQAGDELMDLTMNPHDCYLEAMRHSGKARAMKAELDRRNAYFNTRAWKEEGDGRSN